MHQSPKYQESNVHILYYEDYSKNFRKTSTDLLNFLGYSLPVNAAKEDVFLTFEADKTYGHLFAERKKHDIAALIEHFASPLCWNLLRRYFDGWFLPKESMVTLPAGNPRLGSELAWLLSFEQSVRE